MYFGPKLGQGRHAGFRIRQGVMLVFSMRTAPPPPFGDPKLYHCHYARHTNDSNSDKFDATLTELSVHSTSLTCRVCLFVVRTLLLFFSPPPVSRVHSIRHLVRLFIHR